MQVYASNLIESIITTLHDSLAVDKESGKRRMIDNETSARCVRILDDLARYHISSPDTVITYKEKVEAIIDIYIELMLKTYWESSERYWFTVAAKFLELSADVVARENELTATSVLRRSSTDQDNNQEDPLEVHPTSYSALASADEEN